MSDLKFTCPHCQQSFEAFDCPACGQQIQVSESQLRPAPQAALQNVSVKIERGTSPLGIAALVMGILASLTCWIPFIGLLSIPLAGIGLLFGLIGVIMAAVNKKTGFTFPVSGAIVCLVSIFVASAIIGNTAKAISDATMESERTNQSVVPSDVGDDSEVVPDSAGTAVRESAPPPREEKWINARNAVRQDNVQVRIVGARVGAVAVWGGFGDKRESKDALLSIRIEIKNLSAGKKLDFETWRGGDFIFSENYASLSDNYENTYKRASSTPIGGVSYESIYPGKSITDVLVFEVPVDTIKWLHLELPARNFGGEGKLRIEIPASMIQR